MMHIPIIAMAYYLDLWGPASYITDIYLLDCNSAELAEL